MPTPFAAALLRWHRRHGRAHLPWRKMPTPYRVAVSEFMLQQTQVERVIPAFERFVARFPDFGALAAASVRDVVSEWRGLGYNARALRVRELARAVVERHGGELPRDDAALRALPGVGAYTASAVAAFAFNADAVAIDTNVRRIVARTQFAGSASISEAQLAAAARDLLPGGKGFAFNSALMDLGATICTSRKPKCLICPLRALCGSAPFVERAPRRNPKREGRFETTTRYLRGRIVDRLRALARGEGISALVLYDAMRAELPHHDARDVERALDRLSGEGFVRKGGSGYRLPE